MEDIWNYRAFLDPITKSRIVPPNGIVYGTSVRTVYEMENKYDIIGLHYRTSQLVSFKFYKAKYET